VADTQDLSGFSKPDDTRGLEGLLASASLREAKIQLIKHAQTVD
jgi:hypothetical protein